MRQISKLISQKRQGFMKNDKSKSFLDFYLDYKYDCLLLPKMFEKFHVQSTP